MDRRCQYHIPRQVLGCERPDYPPRIWRRCRVRSRTKSDTDSNACDAIGITESEPVSISGSNPGTDSDACDAIGVTDANANPGAESYTGTHAGTDSDARANNSDANADPVGDANSCDAIGITESEPNACDAIGISDADSDSDAIGITESVTDTVGVYDPEPVGS